jgi:hypothetical protein
MITGIDLVIEQIRLAGGAPLVLKQSDIVFDGHAIECRVNAENPATFVPSPGLITSYHPPGGLGVRVDSAVYQGYAIPPYYDSLVGKLIVHGKTRNECMARLRRARRIRGGRDRDYAPLPGTGATSTSSTAATTSIGWIPPTGVAETDASSRPVGIIAFVRTHAGALPPFDRRDRIQRRARSSARRFPRRKTGRSVAQQRDEDQA